jgi:phospholipid/cholesterol/gamma-HCH transport system substrate-binding protein
VSSHRTEVKVGLFVIAGVIALFSVLLLLGQKRHVFQQRIKVHCMFPDVAGLVVGAPVQIAGVNVGTVSAITFDRSYASPQIRVDFEITRDSLDLLRADSVARISSQGLLGDKLIDVTPGSRGSPPIAAGGLVPSSPPADLDHLVAQTSQVMNKLDRVVGDVAMIGDELASPRSRADIRGSLSAMHELLEATAHGSGLAHALFYDRRTATAIGGVATGVDRLVTRVNAAVAALQPILDATDKDGRQLLNNLSRAALGIGQVASQLESSRVVPNLERASDDLAQVSGQLRSGKGTLGALVQDPTVYEQLVTILGGIGRSRVLRALVRFAISKEDTREAQHVAEPPPGRREGKR